MASNPDAAPEAFLGVPRKERWFEVAFRAAAAGISILLLLYGTLWTAAILGCVIFCIVIGQTGYTKFPFGRLPAPDDPAWYTPPNKGYLVPPGPSITATLWASLISVALIEFYAAFGGLETPGDAKALWVLFFVIVSQTYMIACITGRAWLDEDWIQELHRNWDRGVGAGAAEMNYFKAKHQPSEKPIVYRSFTPGDDIILSYNLISLMMILPTVMWTFATNDLTDIKDYLGSAPFFMFLLIPISLFWPLRIARGPLREKPKETVLHWGVIKAICWTGIFIFPVLSAAFSLAVPSSDPIKSALLAIFCGATLVSVAGVTGLICAFRGIGIRAPDPGARATGPAIQKHSRFVRGGLRAAYHGLLAPTYLVLGFSFLGMLVAEPHVVAGLSLFIAAFSIPICSIILLCVGYAVRYKVEDFARSHWQHIIKTSWRALLFVLGLLPLALLFAAGVASEANPGLPPEDVPFEPALWSCGIVLSLAILIITRAAWKGLHTDEAMDA